MIICLQETWLRSYKNVRIAEAFEDFKWLFKNADSQTHPEDQVTTRNMSYHGTALGVRKDFAENLREVNIQHKNIAVAELRVGNEVLIVGSVYLPTMGKDEDFEEATDALAAALEDFPTGQNKLILAGDMNVDVSSTPRRLAKWSNFLADFDLEDNATGIPTHKHTATGAESELDRVVTRNISVTVNLIHEDLNRSDHSPLHVEFHIPKSEAEIPKKGGQIETKVNIEKLDENIDIFQELTKHLADSLALERDKYDLDTQNGLVSSLIFHAAIEATGQPQFQSQDPRTPRKPKIDRDLYKELRAAVKLHNRSSPKSKKSPTGRRVAAARKAIKLRLEEMKSMKDLKLHREIIHAARSKSTKIFRLLKKIRQAETTANKLPGKITGYGKEYSTPNVLEGLRDLFKIQTTLDYNDRFDEEAFRDSQDLIQSRLETVWDPEEYSAIEISKQDFEKVISKLKPGKAQDYLGLSNDLMKRLHPAMTDLLYQIMSDCLRSRDYGGPVRNYGKGTIIVKKPGKPVTDVKNWRKIVVNTTLNNILQLYVQPKMEEKVQKIQTKYQMGFTAGVPIINAVIAREELQAISKAMRRTLYFGVLDLMSCFPRISREQMLALASDILTPAEWDLLRQIYTRTWGELRIEAQRTDPMEGNVGSVEGGVLSVQILKLFIAVLLTLLERSGFTAGVDFGLMKIKGGGIGAADDILLFCWSARELRTMLHLCQYWSDRFRATFSPDKSVVLIQRAPGDTGSDEEVFELNGQRLEIVHMAEHLGVPIADNGDNSEELVKIRLTKARRAINGSLALFDPKSFVNVATKLELWRRQFKAIVLYSCDTTMIKASQARKIETFQLKILKSMMGLSRRASSVKTRLLAGVPTMNFEIWKNRLGVLNSIMDGDTLTKQYCVLAWECKIKKSWTYTTVKKLHDILVSEDINKHLNAADMLLNDKKDFKENIKIILVGAEVRKLSRDLNSQSGIYKVPQQVFKTPMPMMSSDFSSYGQKLVKSFAAVFVSDFFRSYGGVCLICRHKDINELEVDHYRDTTEHFLSTKCDVNKSPLSQEMWSEIKLKLQRISPANVITSELSSDQYRARFILNPTCLSLGSDRISASDLQATGLDISIRKFCHFRLKYRYSLLKERGYIIKKKFIFN